MLQSVSHSIKLCCVFLFQHVRLITSCPAGLLCVIKIKSLRRRAFPVWQEMGYRDKVYLHRNGRERSAVSNYLQREGEFGQSLFLLEGKVLVLIKVWLTLYQSFDSVDVFDVLLSRMSAWGQFPCTWHSMRIIIQSKCAYLLRCYRACNQCFLYVTQAGNLPQQTKEQCVDDLRLS